MTHPLFMLFTEFCQQLPAVTQDIKWGDNLVFSIGGKMFAIFNLPDGFPFSFKVEPGLFNILTEQQGVIPAPYLARYSWVSLEKLDTLETEKVCMLLNDAHAQVSSGLSAKKKRELGLH